MTISLAILMTSCERVTVNDNPKGIELLPPLGYISFNTSVATKTPIITSLKGESFGVFGFSYSNTTDWSTARPVAVPDIFQNMKVTCDPDTGVPSYDSSDDAGIQLTPWNLLRFYSFFAYYPYGNDNVSCSSELKSDVPIVTYTLPLGTQPVNPDDLVDLMTAHAIDHNPVKSAVVSFDEPYTDGTPVCEFQHRLFCLEIVAQNFNDNISERIRNPRVIIDNLAYQSVSVPLQKGDNLFSSTMVNRSEGAVTFDISGGTADSEINVYAQNDENYTGPVAVSGTKNLMLIPQEGLRGRVIFQLYDEDYKLAEGESQPDAPWINYSQEFDSKILFEEGFKYVLSINFTGDAIVIVLSEAGAWEPFSVNYEFA